MEGTMTADELLSRLTLTALRAMERDLVQTIADGRTSPIGVDPKDEEALRMVRNTMTVLGV